MKLFRLSSGPKGRGHHWPPPWKAKPHHLSSYDLLVNSAQCLNSQHTQKQIQSKTMTQMQKHQPLKQTSTESASP